MPQGGSTCTLATAVDLDANKILCPQGLKRYGGIRPDDPVLVILAAGKGTRFGQSPKCAQAVCGIPLARHSIDAFRSFCPSPVIGLVSYRHDEVMAALGDDNVYIQSDNPTGGTAYAAFEAFCVSELETVNPVLIITMGDRIVMSAIFRRLYETHTLGVREADLTFLTAIYEPPKNRGKGRLVREADRRVSKLVEQRDIDAIADSTLRQALLDTTEGNCPLYAIRARTLRRYLSDLTNDNAQGQYYFTDIVEAISRDGGDIRTITTTVADPEYDLLCSDVTRPMDLAMLEGILTSSGLAPSPAADTRVEDLAERILADRPLGQVASIACQLEELVETTTKEDLGFRHDQPVGIGLSGGRCRIAFMHPDMGRFYGPAWQMPIGAGDASGREQIVILVQNSDDGKIHLFPTNPEFREKLNYVAADTACMYPEEDVADWYAYEGFGTRMAENLLLSLGYFTDGELETRRNTQQPLPPSALWVSNSMRRPFSLIGNAIASMRTLREGNLGAKVQTYLGREGFRGLRVMSTGNIPQGGFSSSSAVTVAVKNAINSLFDLGIAPDMLVHLACQAEYGTGVRAGSLDQATEQKGKSGQGALISSNPGDNYRIIGTFPVPSDRFYVLFPYSVDRDREAWRWSAGTYAATPGPGQLTAVEVRKMTGKASELAAILTRLPLDTHYFQKLEDDFVRHGSVSPQTAEWVYQTLRALPLCATQDALRQELARHRQWYIEQLIEIQRLDPASASEQTDATFDSLFAGWRDPSFRRTARDGRVVRETGAPLRSMVAYLFGEVAKNLYLINHTEEWIEYVTRSQWGDRSFDIDPDRLPSRTEMMDDLDWEKDVSGPELMERWLKRFGATPFDYNRGLEDETLSGAEHSPLHQMEGTSFFRGLALIDLAEAMLKSAFGKDVIAIRVNAAGQGDYFQIHADTTKVDVEDVKQFVRVAFYRRFGLSPAQEFVETHPGGGAVGVRLSRFDHLPELIRRLRDRLSQ